MKYLLSPKIRVLLLVASGALCAAHAATAQARSIFPQGTFLSNTVGQLPETWNGHRIPHLVRISGSHEIYEADDERVLRLTKQMEESTLLVTSKAAVPTNANRITLVAVMRPYEIETGPENPNRQNFRVGLSFFDSGGERLLNATPQITLSRANTLFETFEQTYTIPPYTASVEVVLMMQNCTGIWDIRSIDLIVR